MSNGNSDYLTTRELATLLRIKERKVYDLVATGDVPCTRATGKLLFSRLEIEAWLERHSEFSTGTATARQRPAVMLGSHDPLLEWALKESGCGMASNFNGSLDGLDRFQQNQGMATSLHLYEPDVQRWNEGVITERFSGQPVVLVDFCWRERGLVIKSDLKSEIAGIAHLHGRKLAPRQAQAGSQLLLEQLLEQSGVSADEITYTDVCHTENDAVSAVYEGAADAALGLQSLAQRFNLGFVPLMRERFDLLVDRRAWFETPFQAFMAYCQTAAFRKRAESLEGYDVSGFGTVRFNG